ncbi:uncharacterized protein LOC135923760 isoform X2 [Gordionus sp. m RMFG-2023]|uniref:uncharacterized protein LOC135923760 isoform X2 n=1 Tax=Gordionus sp. m RMFG-2023 TaxID=3053472 RepID=UPI0031FD8DBB
MPKIKYKKQVCLCNMQRKLTASILHGIGICILFLNFLLISGQDFKQEDIDKQYAQKFCTSRKFGSYGDFYFGCQRYITCKSNSDPTVIECPRNTLFDNKFQKCVQEQNGNCYKVCDKFDDFIEGKTNTRCQTFTKCFGGKQYDGSCPKDTAFSNNIRGCVDKEIIDTVTCSDKLITVPAPQTHFAPNSGDDTIDNTFDDIGDQSDSSEANFENLIDDPDFQDLSND